jgi:hypothetical protein
MKDRKSGKLSLQKGGEQGQANRNTTIGGGSASSTTTHPKRRRVSSEAQSRTHSIAR